MKVFKIRDKNGLYSTGGLSPSFTKGGKTWNNIGHVKSHLRQFIDSRDLEIYADAEIVSVEYKESDVNTYDILEFLDDINAQDIEDYEKSSYHSDWRTEKYENIRNRIAYLKQKRKQDETTKHNS